MNIARSLLKRIQVRMIFLGKEIRHAVYLLNFLPAKELDTCTPYEGWFDKTPHFEYLRVIGCTSHVKTANLYIKNIDDKS